MTPFQASFQVLGVPKAQPRTKACIRGAHAGVYDPGTSEGWKARVVFAGRQHLPKAPLDGPIRVDIDLFFPRPKSISRRRDPDGPIWMVAKPDRDNCEKAILDAMKQDGWFRDDSQVCAGEVRKFYHRKGGIPGAEIAVLQMTDENQALDIWPKGSSVGLPGASKP